MADEIAEEVVPQVEETTEAEAVTEPEEVKSESSSEEDAQERPSASYIIERKNRQIEKLREEKESNEQLVERLARLEQMISGQADQSELADLYDKYPDAKDYDKEIRAYMEHEDYKNASPEVIYHHVSYNDKKTKSENKKKVAEFEAKQTRTVGSSSRSTSTKSEVSADDIRNMSDTEFAEYEKELRRRAQS